MLMMETDVSGFRLTERGRVVSNVQLLVLKGCLQVDDTINKDKLSVGNIIQMKNAAGSISIWKWKDAGVLSLSKFI